MFYKQPVLWKKILQFKNKCHYITSIYLGIPKKKEKIETNYLESMQCLVMYKENRPVHIQQLAQLRSGNLSYYVKFYDPDLLSQRSFGNINTQV